MNGTQKRIAIVGAGVAGLVTAWTLKRAGFDCTLFEQGSAALDHAASHVAGGMLAPYCELETAEPEICRLGERSIDLWPELLAELPQGDHAGFNGTLVVAHAQDRQQMQRLERQIRAAGQGTALETVDRSRLGEMEPVLDGRFPQALFLAREGWIDPRSLLPLLRDRLMADGMDIRFDTPVEEIAEGAFTVAGQRLGFDHVIDCRGLAARGDLPDLRGVRGEVAIIETAEVKLTRMVRLMHPRYPLYIVPRGGNRFLIGATSLESEDRGGVTLRSALELLSAAYSLHPAFGEARVVELTHHLRPALPDNLPVIEGDGGLIRLNGLYRHGFLLAPALAEQVCARLQDNARDTAGKMELEVAS